MLCWRGLSGSKLVEDMLTGYDTLQTLVSDISLVVPGHDPLVTELFPAYANSGFVWRLDKHSRQHNCQTGLLLELLKG